MNCVDINIAVAEKVGWIPHPENSNRELRDRSWRKGNDVRTYDYTCGDDMGIGISDYAALPRYTESLDSMHEAEKIMGEKEWNKYVPMLARVIAESFDPNVKVSVPTNILISANADERAEAFLRVFGLWR